VVFLSALKPPRRVLDSTHLETTQPDNTGSTDTHRTAPSPVPVLNSSPPRWAEWWRDRSCSSEERIEASDSSTVAIVGGDDPALLLQAGASRAFSSTVVLTCSY